MSTSQGPLTDIFATNSDYPLMRSCKHQQGDNSLSPMFKGGISAAERRHSLRHPNISVEQAPTQEPIWRKHGTYRKAIILMAMWLLSRRLPWVRCAAKHQIGDLRPCHPRGSDAVRRCLNPDATIMENATNAACNFRGTLKAMARPALATKFKPPHFVVEGKGLLAVVNCQLVIMTCEL